MSDQELKQLWRQPQLTAPLAGPDTDIVARMKKRMRKFDRTIFWRDVRELAACVFVFIGYWINYYYNSSTITRAGCVVIMVAAVFIALKLLYAHRGQRRFRHPASIREFLQGEVEKVSRQIRLLETVVWWYLLPLFIGMGLYSWGRAADWSDKIVLLGVNLFVYAFIYWLNRYAARKSLRPLKEQLEQTLTAVQELSEPTTQP